MAKFTRNVGGVDTEFEISDEELLEATQKNTGVISKLRKLMNLDADKKEEKEKKEDAKLEKDPELTLLKQEIEALRKERLEDNTAKEERTARIREGKAKRLLETAVSEGKIAKGEQEALLKKYKANPSYLEDLLSAKQTDPAIKKSNSVSTGSDGKAVGAKVFSNSEIEKMSDSEYKLKEKDILEALSQGNIVE